MNEQNQSRSFLRMKFVTTDGGMLYRGLPSRNTVDDDGAHQGRKHDDWIGGGISNFPKRRVAGIVPLGITGELVS